LAAAYGKKLEKEIVRGFELVKKHLFPLLPKLDALQRADTAQDADKVNKIIEKILDRYFGGMFTGGNPNLTKYAKQAAFKLVNPMQANVNRFNQSQFTKTFKRISSVDPLQFNPGLSDALEVAGEQNVNKIVSLSSDYFDEIKALTNQALRTGTSVKDLTDQIFTLTQTVGTGRTVDGKFKKSQAHLIAIDQVQKLNADLERTRQQANGISRYIWRDRNNARVRPDHAALDGAVFDYNFPPVTVTTGKRAGETNNPGQDINCKCWGEPVIEDLTGKPSRTLEAAELKTQKLINAGRVPGYKLPKKVA
jgi:SPP1 gp7 family putative phage head morphogenesis protein